MVKMIFDKIRRQVLRDFSTLRFCGNRMQECGDRVLCGSSAKLGIDHPSPDYFFVIFVS
jgi:hypothetical protein